MFCTECGTANTAAAKFCHACGFRLVKESHASPAHTPAAAVVSEPTAPSPPSEPQRIAQPIGTRASRSTFWSLSVSNSEEARKNIRDCAFAFYFVSALAAGVGLLFGHGSASDSLLGAALVAAFAFWLHKRHSLAAAICLLIFAVFSVGFTAFNALQGSGGRNIVLSFILCWAAVKAVVATNALRALLRIAPTTAVSDSTLLLDGSSPSGRRATVVLLAALLLSGAVGLAVWPSALGGRNVESITGPLSPSSEETYRQWLAELRTRTEPTPRTKESLVAEEQEILSGLIGVRVIVPNIDSEFDAASLEAYAARYLRDAGITVIGTGLPAKGWPLNPLHFKVSRDNGVTGQRILVHAVLSQPARLLKNPNIEREIEVWTRSAATTVQSQSDVNAAAKAVMEALLREFTAAWNEAQRVSLSSGR